MGLSYNSLLVMTVCAIFGGTAAAVGLLTLLARRAMAVDLIAHATLPGIAMSFIILYFLAIPERSVPWLTFGGICGGLVFLWLYAFIKRHTSLRDDALLSSFIGVTFGLGIVFLSAIQNFATASQAGLESLLLGSAATITRDDSIRMVSLALGAAVLLYIYKPAIIVALMDPLFTRSIGWSVSYLERVLLLLMLAVVVSGLSATGLILVLSLTVIPPAAALLIHRSMNGALRTSIFLGAMSAGLGIYLSSLDARLPAGSLITLTAMAFFLIIWSARQTMRLARRITL